MIPSNPPLSYFERLERKRANDRQRINRLRADPTYRASENVVENARHKERMATEPEYAAYYRGRQNEAARRRRRIKRNEFRQAAE